MHVFNEVSRRAIGLGFAVYIVLLVVGLVIVGGKPGDTVSLVFWPAAAAGYAVSMLVVIRSTPPSSDK